MAKLPEALKEMGLCLYNNAEQYLENGSIYELEPVKDPEEDWRLDVYIGSTRCPEIVNEYLHNESDIMDAYHQDGVVAGFFCYPLDGIPDEKQCKAILDFREELESAITQQAGEETVTFLGGATGIFCGYLDFIAWDLSPDS